MLCLDMKSPWFIASLLSVITLVTADVLDSCSQRLDSSCSVVTLEAPSERYQCASKGVVRTPYHTRSHSCAASNVASCRDSCLADPGCTTFGYESQTQTCNFYSQPLRSMKFKPTPNNPFAEAHWNRNCFELHCDSPPQPVAGDTNLVRNGGFEELEQPREQAVHVDLKRRSDLYAPTASQWRNLNSRSPWGGCSLSNAANEGQWAMYCREQRDGFGIVQDIDGFEPGAEYTVQAQMAFLGLRDTAAKCAFYLDERPDAVMTAPVIDVYPCKGGWCGDEVAWHTVSGTWVADKKATGLRIDCVADGQLSYLIDEVSIMRK